MLNVMKEDAVQDFEVWRVEEINVVVKNCNGIVDNVFFDGMVRK